MSKQVVTMQISDKEKIKKIEQNVAFNKEVEEYVKQVIREVRMEDYHGNVQELTRIYYQKKVDAISKPLTLEDKIEKFLKDN